MATDAGLLEVADLVDLARYPLNDLVGATAPFLMGLIIGRSGNYNGGLAFLVISCLVLSLPMIPLLRRY